MSLNQVYHYDGVTKTAITASVIKLSATQGVYPDFGGMTVELSYPVLDANGSEVTLEKGDLLWCNVNWATNRWFAPGLGEISDIKRSGDFVTVKVDSMLEPLMRMRYVIDNTVSGFLTARLWDVITKHTPPHGIAVSSQFMIYRRETGSETWNLDTTMERVVHGLEVDVRAYFQYLIEQPINLWLEKPTGTIFPVYGYVDHWDLPTFAVGYSGYGNYRQADLTLSRDNGILSEIEWEEPTASVLNDVTITVRGGGSEQFTDAASIAAYGKRQTTLSRGIYLADAIDGYDATRSIRSIVKSMAVPHKRCRLTCEATAIFNSWQTVGGMYRVIDDATGQDEYMALRSFTYRFPEEVCECVFDNAPLDMSKYGLRMENRVTSLEANQVTAHAGFFDLQGGVSPSEYYHLSQTAYNNLYQQDQGVKTTSSPTFASLAAGNITGKNVTLGSDTDTNLNMLAIKRLGTTGDGTLVSEWRMWTDANRGYLRFYRGGVSKCELFADRSGYWYSNVRLEVAGNINCGRLYLTSGDVATDMVVINNTSATADDRVNLTVNRTNQSGNQLYLSLYDAKNSKWGGLSCGPIRINNNTVVMTADSIPKLQNCSIDIGSNTITCNNLNSSGFVSGAKNIMCSAYGSSATSIGASTWVKIDLAAEEFDPNSVFASDRFTAPVAGKYLVCYGLGIASLAADKFFYADVVKNCTGGNYPTSGTGVIRAQSVGGGTHVIGASKILVLAANDYLELWGYHNDSSSRNTSSRASESYMSVHYLGA